MCVWFFLGGGVGGVVWYVLKIKHLTLEADRFFFLQLCLIL